MQLEGVFCDGLLSTLAIGAEELDFPPQQRRNNRKLCGRRSVSAISLLHFDLTCLHRRTPLSTFLQLELMLQNE